jgi:hypothetical protein
VPWRHRSGFFSSLALALSQLCHSFVKWMLALLKGAYYCKEWVCMQNVPSPHQCGISAESFSSIQDASMLKLHFSCILLEVKIRKPNLVPSTKAWLETWHMYWSFLCNYNHNWPKKQKKGLIPPFTQILKNEVVAHSPKNQFFLKKRRMSLYENSVSKCTKAIQHTLCKWNT